MPAVKDQPRPLPIGTFVLFALACLPYFVMVAALSDSQGGDAAGRGMAAGFAFVFGMVLWFLLAIMLLLAAIRGAMPKWAAAAALILFPLSCAAALFALDSRGSGGAFLVAALLPPLIALYAIWARLPALHPAMPPGITSAITWSVVFLLSAAPLVQAARNALPDPARDARLAEEGRIWQEKQQREEREAREREEARFAALKPDSPLDEYLEYLAPGDSRFHRAVAGARQVKGRQNDISVLLKGGKLTALQEMWRLDLAVTPELCAAYGSALYAETLKIDRARSSNYIGIALDMERQMPNVKWLVGGGCNLNNALALLETNVRKVSDSSRMDQFADSIAAIKSSP